MIDILLPVHNRRETSATFATMLGRQTITDFHLLLIDDGSSDGTADAVTAILPQRTTVLRGKGDWWWGGALHQGWLWLNAQARSDDDVVVICNDDVTLPDDFLAAGLALLRENPGALVVAKAHDPRNGALKETGFSIDYLRCKVRIATPGQRVVCAPTRGLFVRWGDMRRIGGFHPLLLPHYLADLEWTLRATKRGLQIVRDDRLWIVPQEEKTGHHGVAGLPLMRRLGRIIDTKYAVNPLHWSSFVILGFPPLYWLPALARIGLWTVAGVFGR